VRLLSFTVAASMILVPLAAHSQMGCIKGIVVDDAGQPLPGMHVGLAERTWDGGQKPVSGTVTDDSGAFEVDDVPPGTHYELGANNDALVYPNRLPQPISVTAPGPCTTITYDAGIRVGAAKLKFKVTDAATNNPITDLTVHVTTGAWGSWFPVGDFLRAGLPYAQVPSSSKLHIEITAKGYSPSTLDLRAIKPGEVREVVAQLHAEALGCLTGTAVDDSFAPVKNTLIDARRIPYTGDGYNPVHADENGRFRLDHLRPGDYDLYFENEAEGFSRLWVGWIDQPGLAKLLRVTVPATGGCKNVTLNMGPRGAWLDVVAIDADTRQQLSKLSITVVNSKHDRQGGTSNLPEPESVLVPSHAMLALWFTFVPRGIASLTRFRLSL
jgi:Carboxypeptidase regulatory-like domain